MEEKLFDGDFFRSLKRISLWSENRLNGGRGGSRKSTAKGSSVEFSDFREYMPGDDIRRIDWNAYGRSEYYLSSFSCRNRKECTLSF